MEVWGGFPTFHSKYQSVKDLHGDAWPELERN